MNRHGRTPFNVCINLKLYIHLFRAIHVNGIHGLTKRPERTNEKMRTRAKGINKIHLREWHSLVFRLLVVNCLTRSFCSGNFKEERIKNTQNIYYFSN